MAKIENKGENMNKECKLNFLVFLFFALYIILPSYFAIEISSNLPLITGSRILLILLVTYYAVKEKGKINLRIFQNKKMGKSMKKYFIIMIIVNIYFIGKTTEAIKEILTIILEEFIVIWIITKFITTKEKFIKSLEVLAISSSVVAIISIIGSLLGENLFYKLNTVSRTMLMASYSRLGFVRAEAGFGHPVYYGTYNVVMISIIMYLIENTQNEKSWKYMLCLGLDILALIFANSRGSILVLGVMLIYMLTYKNVKNLKKYFCFVLIALIGVIFLFIVKPEMMNFFKNIYVSLINVFSSDATQLDNYGRNSSGLESRTMQISEITWTLMHNPLMGFGPAAHTRGLIKYINRHGNWQVIETLDVGYIAIFCQFGIIGTIGTFILYKSICGIIFDKKHKKKESVIEMFKFIYISYFLCMFSITRVHSLFWVITGLLVAYINIIKIEEKNNSLKERY